MKCGTAYQLLASTSSFPSQVFPFISHLYLNSRFDSSHAQVGSYLSGRLQCAALKPGLKALCSLAADAERRGLYDYAEHGNKPLIRQGSAGHA